jgi:hypothetical protein
VADQETTFNEPAMTQDDLIQELDVQARTFRPRLFAVYGCHGTGLSPFLGWGMEFTEENQALFYAPDNREVWQSSSAAQVLATHTRLGDARLTWLDQP